MTQRAEVRFKFYHKTGTIRFNGATFSYSDIAFNVGGGSFGSFSYTVPVDGVYLIGYSYNKATGTHYAQSQLNLKRNGQTSVINRFFYLTYKLIQLVVII